MGSSTHESTMRSLSEPHPETGGGERSIRPRAVEPRGSSWWRASALRRFSRNRGATGGAVALVGLLLMALFGPLVLDQDPTLTDLGARLQSPSTAHWFGTDELGRDLFARVVHGGRISLSIGLVSVSLGLLVGVPLGVIAAYYGGWTDKILMRVVDIMLSFPTILLAIVVVTVLGPSLYNAMVAIGIAQMPVYARIVRGVALSLREQEFIQAARALGASDARIVVRHLIPNCLPPLIVQSSLLTGAAIISAAYLGFLGLGAQPPSPEWGTMLSKGRLYLRSSPHVVLIPGAAIVLSVLSFNLLGDGLREALDPRLRGTLFRGRGDR